MSVILQCQSMSKFLSFFFSTATVFVYRWKVRQKNLLIMTDRIVFLLVHVLSCIMRSCRFSPKSVQQFLLSNLIKQSGQITEIETLEPLKGSKHSIFWLSHPLTSGSFLLPYKTSTLAALTILVIVYFYKVR